MPEYCDTRRVKRILACALSVAGVSALCVPWVAQAQPTAALLEQAPQSISRLSGSDLQARLQADGPPELYSYYAANGYQPLWIDAHGSLHQAAADLLQLIETAEFDGLDAAGLNLERLTAAVREAESANSSAALAEAEVLLSSTLVEYVKSLLADADRQMSYEHEVLQAFVPPGQSILQQAASAPSLQEFVAEMRWMHPLYAPLRRAIVAPGVGAPEQAVMMGNLERIRGIPRMPVGRHVLVDIASARLWMYKGDRVVDSMKVVVGKPDAAAQTPIMAGYLRYAVFNPYWNVPPEQVRDNIASRTRNMGVGYLKRGRYQVVSELGPDAEVLDPGGINWRAVEKGELTVAVRQLPSATNAMGMVKYEFPNPQGIYLHDTPDKALMLKEARQLSSGCIRLEDAARLGRWLLGGALPSVSDEPEQQVDLAEPVPIYVTYLTAHVVGEQVALGPDPYAMYEGKVQRPTLASRSD